MARIPDTLFNDFVEGQTVHATDYTREREIMRVAINDFDDKVNSVIPVNAQEAIAKVPVLETQLADIVLLSKLTTTELNSCINKTIIADSDITFSSGTITISATNSLRFTNGKITLSGTAKLIILCPIIAGNKLIFIDNTTLDMTKLATFTEDTIGIYIKNNNEVYLEWFYQPTPMGNKWFNSASKAVGNWSKLLCFPLSSFNFKGEIWLPLIFDGAMSTFYAYGTAADYPNGILAKVDYSLRRQFECENFNIYSDNLTDKVAHGLQIGGSQYAKFDRITVSGTVGSPEVQKLDWGLLVQPLHASSQDIDHTKFSRVRLSNCGAKIMTNSSITRGNITELFFEDCAFGNNGSTTDAPITVYNDGSKSAFSIHFDGVFLSQGKGAKGIDITGIKHMNIQKVSQEYYRGATTKDPNIAQYSISITNSSRIIYKNNRFGDTLNNNFMKLVGVTDSIFDEFDIYMANRNTDIISNGDMTVLNMDSASINNEFKSTKSSLIYKTDQTQWEDFRDGSVWDRIDSTKIIGDVSGNTFRNFFGINTDKTPYISKQDFLSSLTLGTNVTVDSANSKINFNRNAGGGTTQNFFTINTKSKFVTLIMKCKITDTVKTASPIFIGDNTIRKQKIVQTFGSFVQIRAFLYVPTKSLTFSLYDTGGTSTSTLEIEDVFMYEGIGGNLYSQLH